MSKHSLAGKKVFESRGRSDYHYKKLRPADFKQWPLWAQHWYLIGRIYSAIFKRKTHEPNL